MRGILPGMKPLGLAIALVAVLPGPCLAQFATSPPTPTPQPTATATPRPAPLETLRPVAHPGQVLVEGKHLLTVTFATKDTITVMASQPFAPSNAYFIATPGTICSGAIKVSGPSPALANAPVTSGGPFTLTRVGPLIGCAISVSSSAGGDAATIVFQ
jgi:hypothetical protein